MNGYKFKERALIILCVGVGYLSLFFYSYKFWQLYEKIHLSCEMVLISCVSKSHLDPELGVFSGLYIFMIRALSEFGFKYIFYIIIIISICCKIYFYFVKIALIVIYVSFIYIFLSVVRFYVMRYKENPPGGYFDLERIYVYDILDYAGDLIELSSFLLLSFIVFQFIYFKYKSWRIRDYVK